MGLVYSILHGIMHLLIVLLLYFSFSLNLFNFFLVLLATGIIDLDHIILIKKRGIRQGIKYWFKISWISQKSQKYPLHNFLTLIIFSSSSFLIFHLNFFSMGIFCLSIALHLLWDIFEDIFIFKVGVNHWKL